MRQILVGTVLALGLATAGPISAKTAKQCDAEYSAYKADKKATQTRTEFLAACRAETGTAAGSATGSANSGSSAGLRKPSAAELEMDRQIKRDMNICIGC